MDDNDLYAVIWRIVGAIAIVLMTLTFASCQLSKYTIAGMVEDGANPIVAACSLKEQPASLDCAIANGRLKAQ